MERMPEQLDVRGQSKPVDDIFSSGGEMGKLMQQIDWDSTPLGPTETWPQSLRTALSICLTSLFPMLIWWGPEMVMLYNDAYRPILGSNKHPTSMGQRGHECWPEIWDVIGPMLEGVLTRGEATYSENQLLLLERNGYAEECYFTFSYSPIRDENGITGIFTAVTETTKQVLNERRLRTLRELAARSSEAHTDEMTCRIALETLSLNKADIPFALLYLFDENAQYAHLAGSAGLAKGTPASPERIALTNNSDTAPWPVAHVATTNAALAITDLLTRFPSLSLRSAINTPLHTALVLPIAKSGQESLYGILIAGISPLHTLDAEYRGFFELVAGQLAANLADARAYEEARARAEALAELDRAKTTFFSNISHEFRTPLTLLLGPLEDMLVDPALSTRQHETLQIVHRNARRLLKLVNTLLDFSRIEAGRGDAVYEETDLASFTTELASTFRSLIEAAGLRYVVDCQPLSEPVYVAHDLWEKIVFNLLSNAFKFTLEGQITVSLRQVDHMVEFTVQDTGIGIAAENLPRIFERFQRVRATHARSFEGSGIGLSLVQELVQLHGGTIHATSAIGEGTTFTITLPMGLAHLQQERVGVAERRPSTMLDATIYIEEAQRWLSTQKQATGDATTNTISVQPGSHIPLTHSQAHLLVVDDNADMRDYLTHILQEYYQIEVATNGIEALKSVQNHQPDLIISDVMMPEADGFQLIQALRANPQTRMLPIILLSARAGEEAAVEGLQSGADDYLVKPFSARELLARVGALLNMTAMRLELAQQAQAHAQRLQQLARTALVINTTNQLEELFSLVAKQARDIVGAHLAITSLAEDTSQQRAFSMVSYSDKYAQWREHEGVFDLSGITSYLQRHHTSLRLSADELAHLPERDALEGDLNTHPPLHGLLAVLLHSHDHRTLGLLVLSDKQEGEFTAEDEAIIIQIGQMIAIAIENIYLYQQLRTSITSRDHLLSMVSHDLKNPLGAIKGYAQLLQRVLKRSVLAENEQVVMLLNRVNSTVNKMTAQVNELLDIAHLQLGQPIELALNDVDLVALVSQVVSEQQATTQKHALHLTSTQQILPISLDSARLERVLANLLANAIKYSPDSPKVDITIDREATAEGDYAVVRIRDYGIGIPETDLPYIFEQFRRATNVIGSFQGSGIGLANAYQIITRHGGTISTQSKEGQGSTFTIRLPLNQEGR